MRELEAARRRRCGLIENAFGLLTATYFEVAVNSCTTLPWTS